MKHFSMTRVAVAVTILAATGFFVFAGDINPPGGAVAPTMKTNQEIFDAVQGLGSIGGGGDGACSEAIPGAPRGVGIISFSTLPGAGDSPVVANMYGFSQTTTQSAGFGGGGSGVTTVGAFTFTRDVDANSFRLFRACTTGTHLISATVTLNDGSQDYVQYLFTDVIIASLSPRMVQRCDGTIVQVEDVSLRALKMRVTNLITGSFWEWNTETASGTGG